MQPQQHRTPGISSGKDIPGPSTVQTTAVSHSSKPGWISERTAAGCCAHGSEAGGPRLPSNNQSCFDALTTHNFSNSESPLAMDFARFGSMRLPLPVTTHGFPVLADIACSMPQVGLGCKMAVGLSHVLRMWRHGLGHAQLADDILPCLACT